VEFFKVDVRPHHDWKKNTLFLVIRGNGEMGGTEHEVAIGDPMNPNLNTKINK
jgi:hypothetical protein